MARMQLQILLLVISGEMLLVCAQSGANTLTPSDSIKSGQSLISPGGVFELGFFSLQGSAKLYVGIWFKNISEQTIVWVANRETPISSSDGVLNLTAQGNLFLVNSTGHLLWSTNTSNVNNPVAHLLDSGNLVLTGGDSNLTVWQSFDHPCNTFLAGMKIGVDFRDNTDRSLSSWKSPTDPSPGDYYYGMETHGVPEIFMWRGDTHIYRRGPWTGEGFSGRPNMGKTGLFQFHFTRNQYEVYYTFTVMDNSTMTRAVLNENGDIQRMVWSVESNTWTVYWTVPEDQCDNYALCGANGICNSTYTPTCECLPGFVPKSTINGKTEQSFDGCLRRTDLNCSTDKFLGLHNVKLPDTMNASIDITKSLQECQEWCKQNCSCAAYTVSGESGCLVWYGDLVDIRSFINDGDILYIRLAASEIDASIVHPRGRKIMIIILLPSLGILLIGSVCLLSWLRIKKKKQGKLQIFDRKRSKGDEIELNLFDMLLIRAATKEFSENNIIGQGGFGPVYKGRLNDGREIAVKRLSKDSVQGLDEFTNEALLIANLQHKNLVRLLGCCVQESERILVYEYMQNKSLDRFLSDETQSVLLSWQTRLSIITGIARGLLYLHHDSRLKIIHRDLKASNILLDEEMNPKISDFGTARIVKMDQNEENTTRVIGTYGYMSPEYAMDGIFSPKSDVYSFGVIMLEIVSGKKNRAASQDEPSNRLVGHAWQLWEDDRCLELVDATMGSYSIPEVLRCIQVALLCVQERSDDRPTMAEVVLMLSSTDVALREPGQPGFCKKSIPPLEISYYTDETPLTYSKG